MLNAYNIYMRCLVACKQLYYPIFWEFNKKKSDKENNFKFEKIKNLSLIFSKKIKIIY